MSWEAMRKAMHEIVTDFKKEKAMSEQSPVVEVAEAVANTIANPGPASILADIELAVQIIKELKPKLAGMHPSVLDLVKLLF